MRLLVITPEFPPHSGGGIGKYYELLCSALSEAGAAVTVLVSTPFSTHEDHTTRDGVTVKFVPLDRIEREAARLTHFGTAPMFRRWLAAGLAAADFVQERGGGFDAIETADFGLLFAPVVALPHRPPVTVTLHGSIGQIAEQEPVAPGMVLDAALSSLTEAIMLPAAERLQAYSPLNAAWWSDRLDQQVDCIPPPFRVGEPAASEATRFSGMVAARIQTWKGPELLCQALADLLPELPADLTIAWAGRDTPTAPDGTSLSDWLSREYPGIWGSRIVPIGPQAPAVIASLQASVRYVLVPSAWDTFNYTIAESMANGRVTVASSLAGASFLIEDGRSGFVCDPRSSEALGRALLAAHQTTAARAREIGQAARETIARELDPSKIASQLLNALASLPRAASASQPNALVRAFFSGRLDGGNPAAFLEQVGIRELAMHLGQRIARKVRH